MDELGSFSYINKTFNLSFISYVKKSELSNSKSSFETCNFPLTFPLSRLVYGKFILIVDFPSRSILLNPLFLLLIKSSIKRFFFFSGL